LEDARRLARDAVDARDPLGDLVRALADKGKEAAARRIHCEVSMETPMACGIGICFTCVARICDQDGDWDYRRTCIEGPVFDATRVVW
jgi:dihydroorotate dehydrogenase electron transfer subunit